MLSTPVFPPHYRPSHFEDEACDTSKDSLTDVCRDAEVVMDGSSSRSASIKSLRLTTGPEGRKVDTGEDWGAPVRATALLIRACTGTRFVPSAIEYSIDVLVELIERANDYKFKVVFTCDSDDDDDSSEDGPSSSDPLGDDAST